MADIELMTRDEHDLIYPRLPGLSSEDDDDSTRIDYVLIHSGKFTSELNDFYAKLREQKIVVTEADEPIGEGLYVTKIHLPWELLLECAERFKLNVPLKNATLLELLPHHGDSVLQGDVSDIYETASKFVSRKICFLCRNDSESHASHDSCIRHYTAPFRSQFIHNFHVENKNVFMYSALRIFMARILLSENGLNHMISSRNILDAYPLHDGPYYTGKQGVLEPTNDRERLYNMWASPKKFYKFQPLELIRRYFGEKIGLYFAWLGFYTQWLVPISFLGILVMLYGLATIETNVYSKEVCNKSVAGKMWMCPSCDKYCSYQPLYFSCTLSKLTSLFENEGIILLAIVMSCWGKLYLEFWRRKERELQCEWDIELYEEDEVVRKEYEESCSKHRCNPITGKQEGYMPQREKCPRLMVSFMAVVSMICVVMVAIIGIIIYRTIIKVLLHKDDKSRTIAKLVASISAAIINLLLIMGLNKVYTHLAIFLTTWECPRTESEFDKKLTLKIYLFQFFNNYSSLFYIAFFKGNFIGHPAGYSYGLSERPEECEPSGCLMELSIQMIIIFCGKQMYNNIQEILWPIMKNCYRSHKRRNSAKRVQSRVEKDGKSAGGNRRLKKGLTFRNNVNMEEILMKPQWEMDYCLLAVDHLSLFNEYLEMVVQFGFVTLFVSAFPLAPFFAFCNNIMEIRLDAYKMLTQTRRPPTHRSPTIGIWYKILNTVAKIAILTNALIISYTTNFIPKFIYRHFYNPNKDMSGIANFTLSVFHVSDFSERTMPDPIVLDEDTYNLTHCFYVGFHEPPSSPRKYEFSNVFWIVAFSRILFVVVFEHVVSLMVSLIATIIPNVSQRVKVNIARKRYLNEKLMFQKLP